MRSRRSRLLQVLWPTANMTEGARHAFNTLRAVVGVLLLAVVILVTRSLGESHRIDTRVDRSTSKITQNTSSLCDFFADIAGAPTPPQASPLGVKIVVDSRKGFVGLGCEGRLAPPSPTLRKLAAKYHIRLDG